MSLAKHKQTLVFYMGLMRNQMISDSLIQHGLCKSTGVAIIENGTRKNQRVITGQLGELSELVAKNELKTPSLIIVGGVVKLSQELAWFKRKPDEVCQKQPVRDRS